MEQYINTDEIVDEAIKETLQQLNTDSIQVKSIYYQNIVAELNAISIYFKQVERTKNLKRSSKLTNPYAPEYGFDENVALAYQISKEKKDQAIVYNRINKILSYLRQQQEITYSLYIKDTQNRMHRYEVPESEIETFTSIVQSTTFRFDQDLREYAEVALERLENAKTFSDHVDKFMNAVDSAISGTKLKLKLADKYEAFEYHYQMFDKSGSGEDFNHSFNIEEIRKWLFQRGHDTAGWWVRGDIGLTSVKSINLNNKFLLLNLASQKSLQEVYQLLTHIFASDTLGVEQLSRLVKAFTPLVYELKNGMNVDVNKIVEDLINSLIK